MSPRNKDSKYNIVRYITFGRKHKRKTVAKKRVHIFALQIILIVFLVILSAFLASYWIGNGFSTNDNIVGVSNTFLISLDSPKDGSSYMSWQKIVVSGGVIGGIIDRVTVWNQDYNVGVPAGVTATKFGLEFNAKDFSEGSHILCVQARSTEGEWSEIATVSISVDLDGAPPTYPDVYEMPVIGVFKPVVDFFNGIVGRSEAGVGDNDLNGNNINDLFETSPITPRHNPMNVAMTNVLSFAFIALLFSLVAYLVYRYNKQRHETKAYLAKYITTEPEARSWYLGLTSLRGKQEELKRQLLSLKQREKDLLRIQRRLETKQEMTLKQREYDRRRFIDMMKKLEREKKEIEQRKGVKIMISPKLKDGEKRISKQRALERTGVVPHPSYIKRPLRRPIYTRGERYGRSKKKKDKK